MRKKVSKNSVKNTIFKAIIVKISNFIRNNFNFIRISVNFIRKICILIEQLFF